ncbi:L-rhamnose mutarotase [Pelagicoccus mobilis]|uniref:L-rhamnose mutarotase n=1 Tax=Pelagicoccus mobilis TaxID=415221 RepID=A0A934VSS8_9BACT|nr:L-rhamnose mutarotase [Pelagicoccus mobilis]MBK1878978.1 L-rhamnose mutarotase [Pelagicoccus mobilis]
MKYPNSILILVTFLCSTAFGFSPYENALVSELDQRVGLLAYLETSDLEAAQKLVADISDKSDRHLAKAGAKNVNVFFRDLNGRIAVFAYYETGQKGLDGLTTLLGEHANEISKLEEMLIPHTRAAEGEAWVRMEWMNCIATTEAFPHDKKEIQKLGLMSGLKPEKELTYRQLHQTNWPGVVDGMILSNYRHWTTFLIEDGDALYMYTYCEYIGDDIDADNKVMAADPATQRWWKHTDPCNINLHGEGNWSLMTSGGE